MEHPFTKDYGWPDRWRIKVCADVVKYGKEYAMKRHNVSSSSIYRWMRAYSAAQVFRTARKEVS